MAEHAPETPSQRETDLPFRPRSDHNQRTSEPRPWTDLVSRDGAERIAAAIRSRTTAEVRFDDQSRALFSTDASNYRQVPIGVVVHNGPSALPQFVVALVLLPSLLARGLAAEMFAP